MILSQHIDIYCFTENNIQVLKEEDGEVNCPLNNNFLIFDNRSFTSRKNYFMHVSINLADRYINLHVYLYMC